MYFLAAPRTNGHGITLSSPFFEIGVFGSVSFLLVLRIGGRCGPLRYGLALVLLLLKYVVKIPEKLA